MLILGLSRGPSCSKEQEWYHFSDVSGVTILLTISAAFACKKSKSQIGSVMVQTESVAYMTNFVRRHIETQFQLHKYSPVHLKMKCSSMTIFQAITCFIYSNTTANCLTHNSLATTKE